MDYKENIIKKSVELWVINDDVEWEDFCKFKEYIRSLPSEKEITKGVIGEYVEVGLPIKYNEGAPVGWENGIAYKHELSILKDCIDWLEEAE